MKNDDFEFLHQTQIRIPEDRIGVLIGKNGEVRRQIEKETGCRINISPDGVIIISGKDAIGFIKAQNVVKAIGKGFNPEIAMILLKDDLKMIEIIELPEYVDENAIKRVKGRIIGKDGIMRRNIEDTLDVKISIYGKSVAIIGNIENVDAAREAIFMLIDGAQHSRVLKFMEKRKREMKTRDLDWQPLY